jgi:glycosyltransferase involved in cell wall biosynthesis
LTSPTILYVTDAPFFSGAERALLVSLEGLATDGCRPVVVVGHDSDLAAELRARGFETIHVPLARTGLRSVASWARSVARLVSVIRRWKPMLIHVNDAPSFQAPGYAGQLVGVPTVAHVRFEDSRSGFTWLLKPRFDRAIFVSEALRNDACREAPALFRDYSEVVYDGVVLPELPDEDVRCAIRHELGLPADRLVVALTGQVAEVKGIWDFVEAARILVGRGVRVTFAVLGDDLRTKGAVRQEMEARVRDLGLAESFRFLGFRPNAPRLIPAFDVVAVPSHVEPLGNATLEAMAAARPVVGSRVGGIPEMIVDGETGWLVPPRDPAALALRLEQLLGDPAGAAGFGRAGRERASLVFGVSRHVARLREVYQHVLNAGGSRPAATSARV